MSLQNLGIASSNASIEAESINITSYNDSLDQVYVDANTPYILSAKKGEFQIQACPVITAAPAAGISVLLNIPKADANSKIFLQIQDPNFTKITVSVLNYTVQNGGNCTIQLNNLTAANTLQRDYRLQYFII